jgi:hypothetical protein
MPCGEFSLAFGPIRRTAVSVGICATGRGGAEFTRYGREDPGVVTFAGTGQPGFTDGIPANTAQVDNPNGVALDQTNNLLYIADLDNGAVRVVIAGNADNVISTAAGNGGIGCCNFSGDGGPATAALLDAPSTLAVSSGNVYLTDGTANRIRLLSPPCSYTLLQSCQAIPAAGGPLNVSVSTSAGCAWTVSVLAGVNWVTITAGLNSTGAGTPSFTVSANTTGAQRSTTLTIAGQPFTLSEARVNRQAIPHSSTRRSCSVTVFIICNSRMEMSSALTTMPTSLRFSTTTPWGSKPLSTAGTDPRTCTTLPAGTGGIPAQVCSRACMTSL